MEESCWLQDFHRDVEWPFTLFNADPTSLTLLLESQGTVESIKLLFPNNPIQSKDKRSTFCDARAFRQNTALGRDKINILRSFWRKRSHLYQRFTWKIEFRLKIYQHNQIKDQVQSLVIKTSQSQILNGEKLFIKWIWSRMESEKIKLFIVLRKKLWTWFR